jgi:coiled-coil domain-containing protein 130
MGVRYNAEKKKIGNYYSTPIYSFRCKCHLCDGWFEIQTDPKVKFIILKLGFLSEFSSKNTRYVVVSGARQKEEDWDPEEHGGFAVHGTHSPSLLPVSRVLTERKFDADTEGNSGPVDPLAALEKTTNAENHLIQVQIPRLEMLQNVSEHYTADPYALSLRVRKRFREEKKIEQERLAADNALKSKYGLPERLELLPDDDDTTAEARREWEKGKAELRVKEGPKKRRTEPLLPSKTTTTPTLSAAASSLRAQILGSKRENFGRHKPPPSPSAPVLPKR